MSQAQDFLSRLQAAVEGLPKEFSSTEEAKLGKKQYTNAQKEIRQIKKELNLVMKEIRAKFSQQSADSFTSAGFTLFGKKKLAGSARQAKKRQLKAQKEQALAPYEQVKLAADDLIIQIDKVKLELDQQVERAKSE